MKQKILKLFAIGFCLALTQYSFAHRVNVFAYLQGNQVMVEGNFAGGGPAMDANVTASYPDGSVVFEGKTNKEGKLNFTVPSDPKNDTLNIVLNAGEGHRNEWALNLKDFTPLPNFAEASTPSFRKVAQGSEEGSASTPAAAPTIPVQTLENFPNLPSQVPVEQIDKNPLPDPQIQPPAPVPLQELENFPNLPSQVPVEQIDKHPLPAPDSTPAAPIPLQELENFPNLPSQVPVEERDKGLVPPKAEAQPAIPPTVQNLENFPNLPSQVPVEQIDKHPLPPQQGGVFSQTPMPVQQIEEVPMLPAEQAVEKMDKGQTSPKAETPLVAPSTQQLEEVPVSPAESAVKAIDKAAQSPQDEKRFSQKDLEAAVLSNQLKLEQEVVGPLRRQLAMSQESVISFKDVIGGIGWLFGIAGLIAWYQSRRKKK